MATNKKLTGKAQSHRHHSARIVTRLRPHTAADSCGGDRKLAQMSPWRELLQRYPKLEFLPLFNRKAEELRKLESRALEMDRDYKPVDLTRYVAIDCPPGIDPKEVIDALRQDRRIETAYVSGGPTPPPVMPADDPRSTNQGYLDAAPDGINARQAWTVPGGDGLGIGFVDLEQGWTLNHEDLTAAGITIISGISNAYHGHGTAVLGEVGAVDNTLGCVGITPRASVRVVSQYRTAVSYNTADAILDAVANMSFGDVLLLEAQTSSPFASGYVPVEVDDAEFDAIRLGTALGIVIVEAAGNGTVDLDAYNDLARGQILNRGSADFRDSGAIMVGAASSATPHTPMSFTNFGSRIDCYAWGENIDTTGDGWTGTGITLYTTSFGGTSGASPIISGAAIALQGIHQDQNGVRLSPRQVRRILSNPANGTPSANPTTDRIGVMPDLDFILTNVLGMTPDVYLRDYVGDIGAPHAGSISASPDIIVRPTSVATPQIAFGEGSGTENDATLGSQIESGQNNFVYVRVRNRGGVAAANVTASVYWSPPATLVTPDLWTLVGSSVIPTVPAGDSLTVGPEIVWPSAQIPGTGHYCFVGLLGTANDPAPSPGDLLNWSNFERFIRDNNNITWRNFNVVNNVPPAGARPPGFVPLPFIFPGAPDRARRFRLELNARLPKGARVLLELPLGLAQLLDHANRIVDRDKKGENVLIALPRTRQSELGEVLLPAKYRARCRLFVQIPEADRGRFFEVALRQLTKDLEVGRLTWRIGPLQKKPEQKVAPH